METNIKSANDLMRYKEIERQLYEDENFKMFAIIILFLAIYIGYQLLKRRFNTGK